ncbi:MAG: TIGR02453 family protein [Bauldia sp.]|nr:TIGR02453 family protein [Bauldia sp.]
MAGFQGFGKDALGFFKALGFHQSREWFQENRVIYDEQAKEPMLALLDTLTARLAKAGVPLKGGPRTIFRINRDVRFSKDKRPYQTHVSAVLTRAGDKGDPGLAYVHIAPKGTTHMEDASDGSFVAVGFHMPEPEALGAIRTAIRRDPKAWRAMEAKLEKAGLALGRASAMKRLPRGYEDMKDSPVADAFLLKSFTVAAPLPEKEITKPVLADTIVDFVRRARPLLDFGWKALA